MSNSTKRRDFLKIVTVGTIFAMVPKPSYALANKSVVAYQEKPNGKDKCGDCSFFKPQDNTCKVVEGTVSPNGWCKLFAKKIKT